MHQIQKYRPPRQLSTLWIFALSCISACTFLSANSAWAKSYQHDYIVFAGEDKHGKVVFALESIESNGGRWDWTQAMETAHLFDENRGWIKLNRGKSQVQLGKNKQIGEGREYGMKGSLRDEMTISSDANGLLIKLRKAESYRSDRTPGQKITRASGKASFYWKGRRVEGRAFRIRTELGETSEVSELVKSANHMHQESFFLNVGNLGFLQIYRGSPKAEKAKGKNDREDSLLPTLSGTLITDSVDIAIDDFRLEATKWMRTGFQSLPYEWQGSFILEGKEVMFKVTSVDLKSESNYLIHGTRIGHAKGFLMVGSRTYPLYGMSRVSHFMKGQKSIEEIEAAMPQPEESGASWDAIVRGYPQD